MAALVLAAHGSLSHPGAAQSTYEHADRIRDLEAFDEVRETFWKEAPSFREVLRTVKSDEIIVVPLFTSEGYFTRRVLPRELRLTGEEPLDVEVSVSIADPVGTHPAMTEVIERRGQRVCTGSLDDVGLAIVGHGTERSETSAKATQTHADRIRRRDLFGAVDALFLDESPYVESVFDRMTASEIAVVPFFIADGEHTTEDIPAAIGLKEGHQERTVKVNGRTVHYSGAIGTEPVITDVILDRAEDAGVDVAKARSHLPPVARLGGA